MSAAGSGQASAAVAAFRIGREAEGNQHLAGLIDWLLAEIEAGRPPLAPELLGRLVNELLGAQQRGDFLYVADLLQYELQPRLDTAGGA